MSLKNNLIRSVVATTVDSTTLAIAPITGAISGVDNLVDRFLVILLGVIE